MKTKICSTCHQDLPYSEYRKDTRKIGRLKARCASCNNQFYSNLYKNDPDFKRKHSAGIKKRRDKKMEYVRSLKGEPCKDCNQKYHHSVMEFDHIGDDKEFSIARASNRSYEAINAEIAKCELVCANCHRIRTWKRLHEEE